MLIHAFSAMGSDITIFLDTEQGPAAEAALAAAEAEFERLEAALSRFRPDSELSVLNREGTLDAGPDLARVVALALDARKRTGGRFDPTVHDALVASGYDRSFTELPGDGPAAESPPAGGAVRLHRTWIELGEGVRLDLGGIGKSYAAERTAEIVATAGPCLVDAAGDIALRGVPAEGLWPVGVGALTLGLERGGVATSGRDRRRWRRGGVEQHHLIDPGTGRPSGSDLVRVTVVADDAIEAEVWAKALFLSGAAAARAEAEERGLTALLVREDGTTEATGALA
jgi:FAD:protein FMN transferase